MGYVMAQDSNDQRDTITLEARDKQLVQLFCDQGCIHHALDIVSVIHRPLSSLSGMVRHFCPLRGLMSTTVAQATSEQFKNEVRLLTEQELFNACRASSVLIMEYVLCTRNIHYQHLLGRLRRRLVGLFTR